MRYELVIIILNYGTPNLVKQCINSIETQIDKKNNKLIIVDNASLDDSAQILSDFIYQKHWCEIILSEKNLGFAGGNNLGIKQAIANYYLLLNSDTIAQENSIKNLMHFASNNNNTGIISAYLTGANDEMQITKFRFHTPFSEFLLEANLNILYKVFRNWQVPIFEDDDTKPDWVSFAAVLIKKDVFEKIGFLDEQYFMYYEDVDFCKRANQNQIKIDVCNNARIIHFISSSTKIFGNNETTLKRRPKYFYKARKHYYKKHFGFFGYISANIFWTLGRFSSLVISPLRRSPKQMKHKYDYIDIWFS